MEEIRRTFTKVVAIIESAKKNAYQKVNEELIHMYWHVGQFVSERQKQHPMEIRLLMNFPDIYKIHFQG